MIVKAPMRSWRDTLHLGNDPHEPALHGPAPGGGAGEGGSPTRPYSRARWYDPALGRFLQPDTIVPEPGKGQAYNRYAYVYNNPVRYVDPSGHLPGDLLAQSLGFEDYKELEKSELWASWEEEWKTMLDQAEIGDLFIGIIGDGRIVVRLMFVMLAEGGVALWDVDRKEAIDLRRFYSNLNSEA